MKRSGGRCPAHAYRTCPVTRSISAYASVAMKPTAACVTNRSSRVSSPAGPTPGPATRADRAAQLPHGGGGVQATADDVADRHREHVVVDQERVVPVAADLERLDTGAVLGGDAEPVVDRQVGAQQGALQLVGDRRLLVEHRRALQRQSRLLPDGGEDPDVERVVARGQDEHAARGVRRTERHDDDAAGVLLDGVGRDPVGGRPVGRRTRCRGPRLVRHSVPSSAPAPDVARRTSVPSSAATHTDRGHGAQVGDGHVDERAGDPVRADALRQGRRRRLQRAELVRGPVRGRPRGEQLALVPRALGGPGQRHVDAAPAVGARCARPPT